MPDFPEQSPAAEPDSRRAFYFNAGFLRQRRIRRIMQLAGYKLKIGRPGADDLIAVWGHSPYAARGEAASARTGAPLIRVEDAFLRSLYPGRKGEAPMGLCIDTQGAHYTSTPSDLEHILATEPLDDAQLMRRAKGAIARIKEAHLSKYNAFMPQAPCPDPGYVLVIDQTRDDASVRLGGADGNSFREMLYLAQEENPGARVIIKAHPESTQGFRAGYFSEDDCNDHVSLLRDPVSPWALLEGATKVYTVSSQIGFEAIFADHRPIVFGQPYYAGWNLTEDRTALPFPRRKRRLSQAQLFAGAMMLYPVWYDPFQDELCEIETVIANVEAQARCWREDHQGWDAYGMRLWKRGALQGFFGRHKRMKFCAKPNKTGRPAMVWASKSETAPAGAIEVEDGFLRSHGLGAQLIPPLSLICDDLGIYYDPTRQSRLEQLITMRSHLREDQQRRAETLIRSITDMGVSKYNTGVPCPELPAHPRVLVAGQVEDDASIRLGAGQISSNLDLLKLARDKNPDASIIYKPHPDVEAGLRPGKIPDEQLSQLADLVLHDVDAASVLPNVDAVWTMTSLLGFEALLRGIPVTVTGAPFYAGWGLTTDLGDIPERRKALPTLAGLAHATLIDYPRYYDPITRSPCSPEAVVARLSSDRRPWPGLANRILAKAQGLLASHPFWR